MPVKHDVTSDGGILHEGLGILTGAECLDALRATYSSDETIRAIRYRLVDLTAVERVEISENEVIQIATIDSDAVRINPDMIIAAVAPADVVFGMVRMWQAYLMEPAPKFEVFRSMEPCREWLSATLRDHA